MALEDKKGKGYRCSYCNSLHDIAIKADACRDSHDIIYIGLAKTDLKRLWQFLFSKDDRILTRSLVDQLGKYARSLKEERKE